MKSPMLACFCFFDCSVFFYSRVVVVVVIVVVLILVDFLLLVYCFLCFHRKSLSPKMLIAVS